LIARKERARERVARARRRLTQFSADIAREQQQTTDAEVGAANGSMREDTELKDEIKIAASKNASGVDERVSEAEATLAGRRAAVCRI